MTPAVRPAETRWLANGGIGDGQFIVTLDAVRG